MPTPGRSETPGQARATHEGRLADVAIDRLRFGFSPRSDTCDPDHVAALAEVLDQVPPILVHAATMRVIDGVHRVLAARSLGRGSIPAVMFTGDETAAHVAAVRANVTHGRPLTLAERQAAATKLLEMVPEWSDRRLAVAAGLSARTIARLRQRATADSPQSRGRLGRDGKVRPVDPASVRHRVAEALRAEPTASNRAIARRTNTSPSTVRDVRERLTTIAPEGPAEGGGAPSPPAPPPAVADTATAPLGAAGPWLDAHRIEDADWRPLVDGIPISRVYEVADTCRRYGEAWRAFAAALEDRARTHRRSSGGATPSPSAEVS